MDSDKRIALLSARLPQQRRQFAMQSRRLGLAIKHKASSPAGLAVAMLSGVILARCWFRVDNADHAGAVTFARPWYSSAHAIFMAFLGHSLV